jgi:hypothetical protein
MALLLVGLAAPLAAQVVAPLEKIRLTADVHRFREVTMRMYSSKSPIPLANGR